MLGDSEPAAEAAALLSAAVLATDPARARVCMRMAARLVLGLPAEPDWPTPPAEHWPAALLPVPGGSTAP